MVQPLFQLDELWSLPTTSVGGLPIAIALPVFEALSFVFTTRSTAYVKFNKFRGIYASLALSYKL